MKNIVRRNRDKILVIIAGLILVVTILCATYAYYYFNIDKQSMNTNLSTSSECFSLDFAQYYDYFTLTGENAVPMHDRKAVGNADYTKAVTVTNNCSDTKTFSLGLVSDSNSTLPDSALKYAVYKSTDSVPETGKYVTDNEQISMSASLQYELEQNSQYQVEGTYVYPLYTSTVAGNSSITVDISLWIDYFEGDRTQTGLNNNTTINTTYNGAIILVPYSYTTAVNTLAAKATDTVADGASGLLKDDTYGTRYIGSDPDNYVYFNCDDYENPTSDTCELWRIIGIENINDKDLVKLVKYNYIQYDTTYNEIAYDLKASGVGGTTSTTGDGVWSRSQLMMTLNPDKYVYSEYKFKDNILYDSSGNYIKRGVGAYYYSETGVGCNLKQYNATAGKCAESETVGTIMDFSSTGLKTSRTEKTTTDRMIQEVTIYSPVVTAQSLISGWYTEERTANSYKWTGKILLPYLTDYAFASANTTFAKRTSCISTTINARGTASTFNTNKCFRTNNWLGVGILMDNSGSAYYVTDYTYFYKTYANTKPYSVKPVLYLNPKVYITGGTGTKTNPYTINI